MLTAEERKIALDARYFGPAWGDSLHGLSPEGAVARSRGVAFGFNRVNDRWYPVDVKRAWLVIEDVALAFGYPNTLSYLEVTREGRDPFSAIR